MKALFAFCVLFTPPVAFAQSATFDLSGVVLDETGSPLPGARLLLRNDETGTARTLTSAGSGRYVFAAMAPGLYSLRAEMAGFASAEFAGLRYFAGTKPTLNVVLKPAATQESTTITGEAPLTNTSFAQLGLSVEERQIVELPLEGRDYLDLVLLESGVTNVTQEIFGSTPPGSTSQNVNGAYARYTTYLLDGFDNTRDTHGIQKVDLGLDSVEELRVITNQFSAEYGHSMSGIVSAVSRSGANELHGTGFVFVRPGAWDAQAPLSSLNSTTGADASLSRQDVGLSISGPIQRDRTRFFSSFEYRNQDEQAVVTAPYENGRFQGAYPLGANRSRFLAKLNSDLRTHHHLELKAVVNDERIEDGVGGLQINENRSDTTNDDRAFYATLSSFFGTKLVSELRFGYTGETYESVAGPPPFGFVLDYPLQGTLGNVNRLESVKENAWQLSETLTMTRGTHGLKAGATIAHIATEARERAFLDGVYTYSPLAGYDPRSPTSFPILFQQGFFQPGAPVTLERDESHVQLFLQDDWQIRPHLTLSLGARWERETSVPDTNNFAPRVGFDWDATRDGRTSVRGGYGVFESYVFSAIDVSELSRGPGGLAVFSSTPADPGYFDNPRPAPLPPDVTLSAPDFSPGKRRSPYAQHFTLGVERQISPSVAVAVDVTYILGQNLILPFNVNAPAAFNYSSGLIRSSAEADRTRPFGSPGRPIAPGETSLVTEGFPFGGYRDLYLLDSRGTSHYRALKLSVTRRYADRFMLQGAYTYSRTENDGDDFRPENSLPLNPGSYDLEWARSATDVPHALVVNGIWDGPYGVRLAGLLRARSGRTIDPRVGSDLDGDRNLRERPFSAGRILDRNSFRTGAFATLDLALSRTFHFGAKGSVEGRFEVFNLTNHLNPANVISAYGRDAASPLPEFLDVVTAERPRQFQLSLRFRF